MKLTQKDKVFLEKFRELLDEKELSIEFREDGAKRLRLRQNYGTRIESEFGMTRQGVRWRFQRLLNQIYPEAYQTILFIESSFGVHLRSQAMAIARQRADWHKEALERNPSPLHTAHTQNGQHKDRSQS
jgi:hypothetical protein